MRGTTGLFLTSILVLAVAGELARRPNVARDLGRARCSHRPSAAFDSNGNVYVGGSTASFGAGGSDVLVVKYASSGTFVWAKTWGGGGDEGVNRIAVGPDGYIYVTGGTDSFGAGWYDVFLLKLDTYGNLIWGTTWGGEVTTSATTSALTRMVTSTSRRRATAMGTAR